MSRPDPRQQAQAAAMSAAFSRAIDLSSLAAANAAPASAASSQQSSGDSPYVIDVTEATFNDVIQQSTQVPVVVDLWASWCGPCKQLSPILERLAVEGAGAWILAKVDVDANPQISQAFGVQSIPTVVAIAAGQPIDGFAGAQPEPQIRQWITGLLDALRDKLPGIKAAEEAAAQRAEDVPEEVDPLALAAQEAMESENYDAAADAYREMLTANPQDEAAQSGLAWAQFLAHVATLPSDAVARADAAPADLALALDAADLDIAAGAADAGFTRLVGRVRDSSGDDRDRVRGHLLERFRLFAADDPAVMAARRALAAALY